MARTKRCLPGAMSGPPVCNPFQLTRSPFTIHSVSIHASTQYCLARAIAGGGQRRMRAFSFPLSPRPGPKEESQGVFRCIAPAGQHAPAGRIVHAPEQLHRHASPSFLSQVQSSRSTRASDPELGVHACAERLGGSGTWSGDLSAWGRDARPPRRAHSYPRRNAPPPALVLPPGMHPPRTLAGTYRPRQLGGPRPEVDHLPRGIHCARVRTASQQETTERVGSASPSATPTLSLLPTRSRRPHWPALSQALRWLVCAIGLASPLVALMSRGPEQLLLVFTVSTLFFLISARRARDCTIQRALLRPRPRIVSGGRALVNQSWWSCALDQASVGPPTLIPASLFWPLGEMRSQSSPHPRPI